MQSNGYSVLPIKDQQTSAKMGFLSYVMRQASSKRFSYYSRDTITDLFISLGGFIAMLTRLTNFVIRGYQGYAIDKSLIKKVFSQRKPPSDRGQTISERKTQNATFKNVYDEK